MRLSTAVLAVLVWAASAVVPAYGATPDEAPVAFVDGGTLSTSCAELAESKVKVPIRNETSQPQEVHYELQLDDENGNPLDPSGLCGGIEGAAGTVTLGPGASGRISLGAGAKTDARTISGSLVVYAQAGRVARRAVTIANVQPGKRKVDFTPLVSSLSEDIDISDHGPIWVPVGGPLPSDDSGGQGTQAVTVGALTGPGEPIAVTYKGETEALPGDDAAQVGLGLEGDLAPGTYKGKVDLDPQDPEAGTVDLELKVSRSWILAALTLLAGIVVGAFLPAASGRMVPRARLRGRVAALSKRRNEAAAALSRVDGGGKPWNGFTIGNLQQLSSDLMKKIEEATGGVLIQIEKPALEGIEAEITAVEKQIDRLAQVPKHARDLEAALELQRAVHLPKSRGDCPKLELTGTEALAGGPVDADALEPRLVEMEGRANEVKRLRHLERVLEKAWLERQNLMDPQGDQLVGVQRTLEEGQDELWDAEGAEGLDNADERLDKAREELAEAWRKKQTSTPPRISFALRSSGEEFDDTLGEFSAQGVAFQPEGLLPLRSELLSPAATPQGPPPPPPDVADATAKARRVQRAIIAFSALVAIAAGLGFLYVGKTWGHTWDFVAAFIWGITGQAIVTSLATSFDGLAALKRLRGS
jgi:hypothetical protein